MKRGLSSEYMYICCQLCIMAVKSCCCHLTAAKYLARPVYSHRFRRSLRLLQATPFVKERRGEMYCWQKVVQRELHRFGKSQNYNHLRSVGHTSCV